MSRTEELTDTGKVRATLQELHALCGIIGPHIRAPSEKHAKS